MSDPTRLLEYSKEAELLLASASDDAPSAESRGSARRAVLASVGVAAASGALLTAGTGKAASKLAGVIAVKWLAALSVPVGAALAAYAVSRATALPPPVASVPPAAIVLPPAPRAVAPPVIEPENAAPALSAAPSAVNRGAERPAASLEQEITELDAARLALGHGDISLLERYLRSHPKGALREQALWMKVSHLERIGQHAQARAAAQRFLSAYPKSAYAARARQLASR